MFSSHYIGLFPSFIYTSILLYSIFQLLYEFFFSFKYVSIQLTKLLVLFYVFLSSLRSTFLFVLYFCFCFSSFSLSISCRDRFPIHLSRIVLNVATKQVYPLTYAVRFVLWCVQTVLYFSILLFSHNWHSRSLVNTFIELYIYK